MTITILLRLLHCRFAADFQPPTQASQKIDLFLGHAPSPTSFKAERRGTNGDDDQEDEENLNPSEVDMLLRLDGDIRFTVEVEVVRRKRSRSFTREGIDAKTSGSYSKQIQSPTHSGSREDGESRISNHNGFFCISTQLADMVPDLFHVLKNQKVCLIFNCGRAVAWLLGVALSQLFCILRFCVCVCVLSTTEREE